MNTGVHLYQISHWGSDQLWYTNDVKNLCGRSAKWYTPMRILGLSVDEYIQLLLDFKATGLHYYVPTDCLTFHFITEKDAKAFCSYVNKIARRLNYRCA